MSNDFIITVLATSGLVAAAAGGTYLILRSEWRNRQRRDAHMAKLPADRTELAEKIVAGGLHPLSAYRIGRGTSVSALARAAALSPDAIRSIELSEMPNTSDAIKAVTTVIAAEIASGTNGSSGTGFLAGDGFSDGGGAGGVDAGGGAM